MNKENVFNTLLKLKDEETGKLMVEKYIKGPNEDYIVWGIDYEKFAPSATKFVVRKFQDKYVMSDKTNPFMTEKGTREILRSDFIFSDDLLKQNKILLEVWRYNNSNPEEKSDLIKAYFVVDPATGVTNLDMDSMRNFGSHCAKYFTKYGIYPVFLAGYIMSNGMMFTMIFQEMKKNSQTPGPESKYQKNIYKFKYPINK